MFANGKRNGEGVYYFGGKESPKATYTGSYVDGRKCGKGKMVYPDGTTVCTFLQLQHAAPRPHGALLGTRVMCTDAGRVLVVRW
eukprot:SAG11_NODE_9855_length_875_cov_1.128866_2_plen_84_part_00